MKPQDLGTLKQVIDDLQSPGAWLELAALVFCLALAYSLSRWLAYALSKNASLVKAESDGESIADLDGKPSQAPNSVWFGTKVLDGLLFPVLALALVYLAYRILDGVYPHVAILTVAVPILVSLAVIRFFAQVLTSVFPSSGGVRLVERGVSWLAWAAAVLWILGLLPSIMAELDSIRISFGKTSISVRMIIEGALSSTVVLMLALWLSGGIEKRVLNHAVTDLSMRKAAVNAVRALLLMLGLLVALSAVGVDLTALSVLGGALGVGLGFGLQKLAANYVSGFVILLERSLRIGDMVRVDNFEGRITDIKTRYTLIRALNGRESVVPNEKLITERIENLSLADPNVVVSTKIVVGYDSDVGQVQSILCNAALGRHRVLVDPAPAALLSDFAADGLEFTLNFWIADAQNGEGNVRSEIRIAILDGLRAANITIPYPQRVVRME